MKLDEHLTKQLNATLPNNLDPKFICLSNTVIADGAKQSYLLYLAKSQHEGLVMVLINLTQPLEKESDRKSVKIVPVVLKEFSNIGNYRFKIEQCPLMKGVYSLVAQDTTLPLKFPLKQIFISSISVDDLWKNQDSQVEAICITGGNECDIRDVAWHPYSVLTIVALTEQRLLVYDLEKNPYNYDFSILLSNLKLSNFTTEYTKPGQFIKLTFAQPLNEPKGYSSLGRKLSLYLLDKSNTAYLLFPFICQRIVIDHLEKASFDQIMGKQNRMRNARTKDLANRFKGLKTSYIKVESNQKDTQKEYILLSQKLLPVPIEIFKVYSLDSSKNIWNGQSSAIKFNQLAVLTLYNRTIFVSCVSYENNLFVKLQIFSEEPYSKLLLNDQYHMVENFGVQTAGEMKIETRGSIGVSAASLGELCMLFDSKRNKNELFIKVHDVCYRIEMNGLANVIDNRAYEELDRLINVDILFDTKNSYISSISMNELNMFMITSLNNIYTFNSIPLQSIQLSEQIQETIRESEELFQQLSQKAKPKSSSSPQEIAISFEEIQESDIVSIQQKLQKFTEDYKKMTETQILKIKTYYEKVRGKHKLSQQQEILKQQITKLVEQAESNDKKIKQLLTQKQKNGGKLQRQILRKINGVGKMVDECKNQMTKEWYEMQEEPNNQKRDAIIQCNGQLSALFTKLEGMRAGLVAKRDQLKKQLGKL